jgi:hypothetical protein
MDELKLYLENLLQHQCRPSAESCADCRSLQRIFQFMQTEIFSTVIFTETPMLGRQTAPMCAALLSRANH